MGNANGSVYLRKTESVKNCKKNADFENFFKIGVFLLDTSWTSGVIVAAKVNKSS